MFGGGYWKSVVAKAVHFYSTRFTSRNVSDALEELFNNVNVSASPGFSFGRSGSITAGSFLQCDTVPSNVVGRRVYINSATVRRVFVGNQLSVAVKYEVVYHYGNEVGLTVLGSVTTAAGQTGGQFPVTWAVPTDSYLAVRVASDSPNNPRDVVAGLELRGTTA